MAICSAWHAFFWLMLGTVISCSITTCALCANLLSWFNTLSPLDHRNVRDAFGSPSFIFWSALGPLPLLLTSVIIISVLPGRLPKTLSTLLTLAVVASVLYYVEANWHPCSTMSHIEHSLSPTAIPGAMSACRQMTALNALSVINLFSYFGFSIAVGGVNARKSRTPNRAQVNINNDRPQDDNEVDLREMAHHLDALDNV